MPEFITITDWSQIPEFANEEEEDAFWATHVPADGLVGNSPPNPEENTRLAAERIERSGAKSRNITVRVEDDMLTRLKAIAARKGIPYQTMLKQFAIERLYEEEKRLGIIEPAAR